MAFGRTDFHIRPANPDGCGNPSYLPANHSRDCTIGRNVPRFKNVVGPPAGRVIVAYQTPALGTPRFFAGGGRMPGQYSLIRRGLWHRPPGGKRPKTGAG